MPHAVSSPALPMSTPAGAARAARQARGQAPALAPLKVLDRTHRQMLAMLDALSQLVAQLDAPSDETALRTSAKAICQFFGNVARQHHADEETVVFPALVRQGDRQLIQHVLRLQQDHGWLEEDWLALAPQLQAVAQGWNWYEPETLRHAVAVFTTLYHEHIALEESLIYPQARAQLEAEAAGRAARQVAAAADDTPA